MTLLLSVAQLNYVVGDMAGNAQKIIDAARTGYQRGVRLLLTPELSICGYAAEDLFLRPSSWPPTKCAYTKGRPVCTHR